MDRIIKEYKEAKQDIESIITKHLREALAEVNEKYRITPTDIWVSMIRTQNIQDEYANGALESVSATLGTD